MVQSTGCVYEHVKVSHLLTKWISVEVECVELHSASKLYFKMCVFCLWEEMKEDNNRECFAEL